MKMWIDTEFNEYRGALISMALVAEDGGAWYGVRFCDDPGWWVREHVMPHLNREPARDADLRRELAEFLAQYDSVHIVSDWPGDIAHFCNFLEYAPGERIGPDRITFEVRRDLPDTSKTSAIPHNALEDARALARGAVQAGCDLRAAANAARRALSELLMSRDPVVYSDALRMLDEALGDADALVMPQMLCDVWMAFGTCDDGRLVALPEYAAASELAVGQKIMEVARREGYRGTLADRLQSLQWSVRRVTPTP